MQLTNSGGEWCPAISPDGEWLVFTAYDKNGIRIVYKTELRLSLCLSVSATVDVDLDTLNLKNNGQWITAYINAS